MWPPAPPPGAAAPPWKCPHGSGRTPRITGERTAPMGPDTIGEAPNGPGLAWFGDGRRTGGAPVDPPDRAAVDPRVRRRLESVAQDLLRGARDVPPRHGRLWRWGRQGREQGCDRPARGRRGPGATGDGRDPLDRDRVGRAPQPGCE